MISPITVQCQIHVERRAKGRKLLQPGEAPVDIALSGRVPRVSRLMALAIHFESLLSNGQVKDYAEIAKLGHVSRARVTQIMNLLLLAPDIQEAILYLSPIALGREPLHLRRLQELALEPSWIRQRKMWKQIVPA